MPFGTAVFCILLSSYYLNLAASLLLSCCLKGAVTRCRVASRHALMPWPTRRLLCSLFLFYNSCESLKRFFSPWFGIASFYRPASAFETMKLYSTKSHPAALRCLGGGASPSAEIISTRKCLLTNLNSQLRAQHPNALKLRNNHFNSSYPLMFLTNIVSKLLRGEQSAAPSCSRSQPRLACQSSCPFL